MNRSCNPYIIICFILSSFYLHAQEGKVILHEQPAVSALMDRFVELNKQEENLEGWRIQIMATDDKRSMEREKIIFENRYPQLNVQWVYEMPYYKLRVGAFYTRLEAERQLNEIRKKYASAYSVRVDDLEVEELLGN